MVRFPTAVLFSHLLVLVGATFTDPTQWPGYNNLPLCVQGVFPITGCPVDCTNSGCIPCDVGCASWTCACNHFAAAIAAASSAASSGCSTSQTDGIASATSVVNGFCSQLLAPPTTPTSTPAPTSTSTPAPPPTTSSTSSTSDTSTSSTATPLTGARLDSSGGGPSQSNKLSLSDKIAIGVGIGVGLPGAIVAIWQMCRWIEEG